MSAAGWFYRFALADITRGDCSLHRRVRHERIIGKSSAALLASKHELAQHQPQAESKAQSRGNKSHDIRPVERLNAGIAYGAQERKKPEHEHEQTDDDPCPTPSRLRAHLELVEVLASGMDTR